MDSKANIKNNAQERNDIQIQENKIFKDWGWRTGWLFILGFTIIQIYMALLNPSFYHPDEIYQSYEIGHYLYYHYGIRAWEWLYHGGGIYTSPLNLGPIRSLLTPLFFYALFALGSFLNLNYWTQTLPMIRVLLALNFTIGMIALGLILREWKSPFRNLSWLIFWILIIIYPDTLVYGSHAFTNTIGLTPLWWGLLLFLWSKKTNKKQIIFFLNILAGFLVGIALWIRPDFILLIIPFILFFFPYSKIILDPNQQVALNNTQTRLKINFKNSFYTFIKSNAVIVILGLFIGSFLSFLMDGVMDFIYWGQFAISLIDYVQFNSNPANSALFGVEPIGYYFYEIFLRRPTFSWLLLLDIAVIIVISKIFFSNLYRNKRKNTEIKKLFSQLWLLSLIIVVVLVIWELEPHKELRFILYWEYFFFAFSAYCLSLAIWGMLRVVAQFNKDLPLLFKDKKKYQRISILILVIFVTPFFLGIYSDANNVSWHNFDDVLAAEEYIGQQNNLTGLIIIGSFWYDGGYTYLHRNVSILHIDDPGSNGGLNNALKFPSTYNYLLVPRYKYLYYPVLAQNLRQYNWTLIKTILGRSDVWTHKYIGT